MIKLARLFSKGKSAKVLPKVPEGERYYVIGDIHGRWSFCATSSTAGPKVPA